MITRQGLGTKLFVAALFCASLVCHAWAGQSDEGQSDNGQADLDKAMKLKVTATTLEQLGEVATLCEQAIEKGLNADDEAFAIRLLTGTLYQRARPQVELLIQARQLMPQLRQRRDQVLAELRKIIKYDDKFGQAYLMISQLEGLPGGDRDKARKAADQAIKLLAEDKDSLAEAFLVRGQLQETEEARLKDFDKAVELSPEQPKVWQTRAFYFLSQGQVEKAVADLDSLLKRDGDNLLARLAIAETLLKLDKVDDAMKHVNRVIEDEPNVIALKLRAQLWSVQEKFDKALEDVEAALKLEPSDLELILMRARLYHLEDRNALAKTDVERVLRQLPDFAPALDLRSSIEATMGDYEAAVHDVNTLLKRDPGNLRYRLQLGIYQNAAGASQQAIDIFTDVLKADPGNPIAVRGRADAYLNIGAHKKAVADYEVAVKSAADDSGVLNNFSWVLATSPVDDLRDGKRALELALRACELTEYKAAHILSTLAASYAELGDFENAVKWSEKACEIVDDDSIREHLEAELESYRNKKPWRENKTEEAEIKEEEKVEESAEVKDK